MRVLALLFCHADRNPVCAPRLVVSEFWPKQLGAKPWRPTQTALTALLLTPYWDPYLVI